MVYKDRIATMKSWDSHTKRLKYCSSEKIDEHNNKFCKGWLPGSEVMLSTDISILTTLKIYLSGHLFIKYDIFESNVNFTPRGTPIFIITKYCEHHNMSYIYQ